MYRTDLDGDVVIGQTAESGQVAVTGQHGGGIPGDQAAGAGAPQPGDTPNRRHGNSHGRGHGSNHSYDHDHDNHEPAFP